MIVFKMPAGIHFYIKFLLGLNVLLQLRWIKTFYVSQTVCWKNIMFNNLMSSKIQASDRCQPYCKIDSFDLLSINIDVNEYSYLGIKFITLCKL